jgi:hypothetical protein
MTAPLVRWPRLANGTLMARNDNGTLSRDRDRAPFRLLDLLERATGIEPA